MTKSARTGAVRVVSGEGRRESRPEGAQGPEARTRGATIGLDLVMAFCRAVRAEILDEASEFGKRYLGLLVEEIRLEGQTAVMRGSEAALAEAVSTGGEGIPGPVPRFGPGWLP